MLKDNIIKALSDIEIFSKIDNKILEKIALEAKLINLAKGKFLFNQEQLAKKFYIVIKGSIALTYLNCDGEELIVEIAENEDFLQDVFVSSFLVNAKAINSCQILAIDRLSIIELLKLNNEFSYNFFSKNAQRNHKIFAHLIELKGNNAKFKVANFLLGLFFDQGQKNKQALIKYDKSLIASYLGMKPETLSRILKKLKSEGEITIKKNLITFLKIDSLCQYCNQTTREKCLEKKCL
jgi:CRP-like cAMP-binding protein